MTILKFSTAMFGSAPPEGLDSNPTYGHALAEMLQKEFQVLNYKTDEVIEKKDWGWSFNMMYYRQEYMIGTLAYSELNAEENQASGQIEYLVQFDKKRTFRETFLRQNKFKSDEPIIDLTTAILKFKIPDMTNFSKEP